MRSFAQNVSVSMAGICLLSIINHYSPEAANMLASGLLGFCFAALLYGKGGR